MMNKTYMNCLIYIRRVCELCHA